MNRWYVLQVKPGSEKKIRAALTERVERFGLGSQLAEVAVPLAADASDWRGMGGYLLIRARLSAELVSHIGAVKGTQGLLGGDDHPTALNEIEARSLLGRSAARRPLAPAFDEGDTVRICNGPMSDFTGTVLAVNGDRVRVQVEIFGRATPAEIAVSDLARA